MGRPPLRPRFATNGTGAVHDRRGGADAARGPPRRVRRPGGHTTPAGGGEVRLVSSGSPAATAAISWICHRQGRRQVHLRSGRQRRARRPYGHDGNATRRSTSGCSRPPRTSTAIRSTTRTPRSTTSTPRKNPGCSSTRLRSPITRQQRRRAAPAYSVVFNLLRPRRRLPTGRPGFQVLTDRLLAYIQVKDGTTIVRQYDLTYQPNGGDFGKTLLQKISELGKGGTGNSLGDHVFTYNTTPKGSTGTPNSSEARRPRGPISHTRPSSVRTAIPSPSRASRTSRTPRAHNRSASRLPGAVKPTPTKGVAGFEDMNGDGLPDYLPFTGTTSGLAQQISPPGTMAAQTFPGLPTPYSEDDNQFMSSSYNFLVFSGSQDYGDISPGENPTHRRQRRWPSRPGDRRLEQSAPGPAEQGPVPGILPAFSMSGYQATGLGFDCSDIWTNNGDTPPTVPSGQSTAPSADVITRWTAPYTGLVQINGQMQRQAGSNPLVASLYIVNQSSAPTGTTMAANHQSERPRLHAGRRGSRHSRFGLSSLEIPDSSGTAKRRSHLHRVGAVGSANQDGLLWDTNPHVHELELAGVRGEQPGGLGARRVTRERKKRRKDGRRLLYKPWTAAFSGNVQVQMQVDKRLHGRQRRG